MWALWGGYAPFALTDFPAAMLFLGASIAAWERRPSPLLAGIMIGLAYNLRPAYIVAMATLVILLAFQRTPARAAALLLGIALVLAPQALENIAIGASPLPPVPVQQSEVVGQILAAGLRYQRTATAIDSTWPSDGITSCDPAGARMAAGVGNSLTATEYLEVLARDPVASAGLLTRRYVNGLWLDERGPVVYSVAGRTLLFGTVNVILLGLLLALALSGVGRLALLLAVLACLPAVAAVVEPRYFMPIGVVAAAMLVLVPGLRWLRGAPGRTRAINALFCLSLVGMTSGVATATTAHDVPGAWFETGRSLPVPGCQLTSQ